MRLTVITAADVDEVEDRLRYVRDEVELVEVRVGELCAAARDAALPDAARVVLRAQLKLLAAPCPEEERGARLGSIARSVRAALDSTGRAEELLEDRRIGSARATSTEPAIERLLLRLVGQRKQDREASEGDRRPARSRGTHRSAAP